LSIAKHQAQGRPPPPYVVAHRQKFLEGYRAASAGKLPLEAEERENPSRPFDLRKGFQRPIYVLFDRGCASSCESGAEFLAPHPNVITVGENTGGFVHFGNLGCAVLPVSRIVVFIATDYWKFDDGRDVEKTGYAPKIRVPPGTDALEAALEDLGRRR
jgi:C-terminal processing protease CtpA/Prc